MKEMTYKDVIINEEDFFNVDKHAKKNENVSMRIMAFLMHILKENHLSGNTKMTLNDLLIEFRLLFAAYSQDVFINALDCLEKNDLIIRENGFVALKKDYLVERSISESIKKHLKDTAYDPHRVIEIVDEIDRSLKYPLGKQQRDAVIRSCLTNFFVLLGGPGTGKSTTLKTILGVHQQLKKDVRIALLAPTGAAAKRMHECCSMPAVTIQSWLRAITEETPEGELKIVGYHYNKERKIEVDLVVVDETSMVDAETMASLFDAIDDDVKIIFIGDPDQLPSVGAGNCLADIEKALSSTNAIYKLTETFRQKGGGESLINVNAKKIINGDSSLSIGNDFKIINCKKDESISSVYSYSGSYHLFPGEGMILSGLNRNESFGTAGINAYFQEQNPYFEMGDEFAFKNKYRKRFFLTDRIMFTKNTRNVKNGDCGIIDNIYPDGVVSILMDTGETLAFRISDIEIQTLKLAYAITVHKAQGQEADNVFILLDKTELPVLSKNLLFTAITRAKKKVFLFIPKGNNGLIERIVKKTTCRSTWLKEFFS